MSTTSPRIRTRKRPSEQPSQKGDPAQEGDLMGLEKVSLMFVSVPVLIGIVVLLLQFSALRG
ncbi:hypothetical protein GCM10023160_06130 [Brachybacterium paraconglomeratum]